MNNSINIVELFSGIGGFSKGFQEAGYNINDHYYSEIDKHAIANYKYYFPNAKPLGSVINIQSGNLRGIYLLTMGSPCQDFSIAGNRAGLNGERSSLIEYGIYNNETKKIPKTQRYKMLGNAVTVNVVTEIAKRLNIQ